MIVISGIATAFNFLVIYYKWQKGWYLNAVLDAAIFVAICLLFVGSATGMQIGMIASFIVSIALLFFIKSTPNTSSNSYNYFKEFTDLFKPL